MSTHCRHLDIRWETVNNIDKAIPSIYNTCLWEPKKLINLVHIGVDEVAKAKGHDYMTVVCISFQGNLFGLTMGKLQTYSSTFLNNYHRKRGNIQSGFNGYGSILPISSEKRSSECRHRF